MRRLALIVALLWAAPAWAIGTINIANAPEWASGASHAQGDRIVAGPAWNGSAYTNGSNLFLWAKATAGTQVSGSSAAVFNTCATPAGVGGIPTGGSNWASATTVTDGGITWTCLTPVDYVSITSFNCDDAASWQAMHSYAGFDQIVTAGNCYTNYNEFAGLGACTSGSTPPTGSSPPTDGTCAWIFRGTVPYTSQTNRWPHQTYLFPYYYVNFTQNINVQVWWGGNQRTQYTAGQDNEFSQIQVNWHADAIGDTAVYCNSNYATSPQFGNCPGYIETMQPASGDSFKDNITATAGPLRYDPTKGVAIFNNAPVATSGVGNGLSVGDGDFAVKYIQISATNAAFNSTPNSTSGNYFNGPTNTNACQLIGNLLSGGGNYAVTVDAACNLQNNVIIFLNNFTAGSINAGAAIFSKYDLSLTNNTIICANTTNNSTGLQEHSEIGTRATVMYNNLVLGCAVPFAYETGNWPFPNGMVGSNNATDVSGTLGATIHTEWYDGNSGTSVPYTIAYMTGTPIQGLVAANQLVNSTPGASFDGRVKGLTADIYGAGTNFSYSNSPALYYDPRTPGADILGASRPLAGRVDIGAEMFIPGTSIAIGGARHGGLFH